MQQRRFRAFSLHPPAQDERVAVDDDRTMFAHAAQQRENGWNGSEPGCGTNMGIDDNLVDDVDTSLTILFLCSRDNLSFCRFGRY